MNILYKNKINTNFKRIKNAAVANKYQDAYGLMVIMSKDFLKDIDRLTEEKHSEYERGREDMKKILCTSLKNIQILNNDLKDEINNIVVRLEKI